MVTEEQAIEPEQAAQLIHQLERIANALERLAQPVCPQQMPSEPPVSDAARQADDLHLAAANARAREDFDTAAIRYLEAEQIYRNLGNHVMANTCRMMYAKLPRSSHTRRTTEPEDTDRW